MFVRNADQSPFTTRSYELNTRTPLLTDNAVIQRCSPLPIAGHAECGSTIAVTFLGNTWTTRADENGEWQVDIGPLESGGPDTFTIQAGQDEQQFCNVVVGDVWVCSGQSNMEMALRGAENGEEDSARAADPGLRLLAIPNRVSSEPVTDIGQAAWHECTPETVIDFSGLAYYTAKALRKASDVPIGLVLAARGETPGEAWVPMEALESEVVFSPILERWRKCFNEFPDHEGKYEKAFVQWDHDADLAEREGRPIPGPHPKMVGPDSHWTPAGLFNGMIAPLTSTPVKGILWYQGAGAPERAFQYRTLFRRLIQSWRKAWQRSDLPFIYGQEANFGPRRDSPSEHSWAELREAQFMGQSEPNTAMAVAIDLGEEKNIHPIRKAPLGERLALAARKIAYGEDTPYSGPTYKSMSVEGDTARIQFDHTYDGLKTSDGRPLIGFAISAGCTDFSKGNRGFVWADARIDGNDISVRADSVAIPVAVRYAWAQNPDCNLVNSEGLPAVPFRTDDWPGVTVECL